MLKATAAYEKTKCPWKTQEVSLVVRSLFQVSSVTKYKCLKSILWQVSDVRAVAFGCGLQVRG